jgi:hypothetical protein
MPRTSPIRSAFNAGELSPLVGGRVEISKYSNGSSTCLNFIPSVQGPAVRRPGTRYVSEIKNSNHRTWLSRFEFNVNQSYVLEFGDYYIRFYTNHGQLLLGSTPTAWSSSTAYAIGDLVSRSGVNYYCKVAHTNQAPPNTTYWLALAGSIYEIPSPYSISDLTNTTDNSFTLDMVQTGDEIFICHPNYPVYLLARYGVTKWTMTPAVFKNGPFKDANSDKSIKVYSSGTTGSVTLTASSGIFTANHVGAVFYMEPADLSLIKPWYAGEEFKTNPYGTYRRSNGCTYMCTTSGTPSSGKVWRTGGDTPIHTYGTQADGDGGGKEGTVVEREGLDWQFVDNGRGYVTITGYSSSTSVSATVSGDFPLPMGVSGSSNATFRWAFGSFSNVEGYPSKVTFFRERLTFVKGQQLFFSVAGDFQNFARLDDTGTVVADRAIQITLTSDQTNQIEWLMPTQALLIGTSGQEFACMENTTSEAFAPANVKVEQQTAEGSRSVKPVRVGFSTLFVQRSGRKLKELAYNFQQNGYVTADMTVLAEHITAGGIQQLDWHKEPYVCAWAVRGDGALLGFTYNKEQDVVGWHRHQIGGTFSNGIAQVESVCVIPAPDKTRDDLWLIVKRTINGQTKRYVEYMEREYQAGDAQSSCYYVDCGATYSGPSTSTVTGLTWLEGQTVSVLVDGAAHPNRVVSGGSISLQNAGSVIQVGLGYTSDLVTNRIEAGAGDGGTSQGKMKRINKCVFRFYNTLGAYAGPDALNLDEILFRFGSDPMNQAPPLFSGDILMEWPNGYDFDGFIMVRQAQPLPMTVVAIMPQLETFDRT